MLNPFPITGPCRIINVGANEVRQGDPLVAIEEEMKSVNYVRVPGLPSFTGGAVGYIGFDCFQYFEPTIQGELEDPIGLPDAVFMMCDTLVIFDRVRQIISVVSHVKSSNDDDAEATAKKYASAKENIEKTLDRLQQERTPVVPQPSIQLGNQGQSDVGKEGYEQFVTTLKRHIVEGDIFQAVPSQRIARPTSLHPFNAYRHLRSLNPSPYMFYVDLKDFQIVGASPEVLAKVQDRVVYVNPIAGTRKRGKHHRKTRRLPKDCSLTPRNGQSM